MKATNILLAVIVMIGLGILYQVTRLPPHSAYASCQQIIGMDGECEAKIAMAHAMRGGF